MKYKLAIFDLDGTILNTLDDLADSCNYVLESYKFPTHSYEKIKYFVGNGIPKLIERAIPDGNNNPEYENVLKSFIDYYENHKSIKTCPYDGIPNLLNSLKQQGFILAVNSNKLESAAVSLCNKFFPEIFDFVTGGNLNTPPKPNPYGVNQILSKFPDISNQQAVFIGDSDVDIQTGNNSHITSIGVSWGFRGKEFLINHGASIVVDNPNELLDILLANEK